MLMERKSLKESEEFIEELNEELQESHFLMAIYFDAKSPQSDEENEKSVMVDDKMMNIPLMSDPEDEQKKLVPIFTHWNAIQRWRRIPGMAVLRCLSFSYMPFSICFLCLQSPVFLFQIL